MIKRGMPPRDEPVVCKVVVINPNSAMLRLLEYNAEGMVHISEVSSGWVRDIRRHLKVGQVVVAKTIFSDRRGITLSLKRVSPRQANEKMKLFRAEDKAEKMIMFAAEKLGQPEKTEQVFSYLSDTFGSLHDGLKVVAEHPDSVKMAKEWISQLQEIIEKNAEHKTFEFRASVALSSTAADGIEKIKSLLAAAEADGLKIHYVSAPNYLARFSSEQAKKGNKEFEQKLALLADEAKKSGVSAECKIL